MYKKENNSNISYGNDIYILEASGRPFLLLKAKLFTYTVYNYQNKY